MLTELADADKESLMKLWQTLQGQLPKKHTALSKVLTSALFVALAVFLIFGHEWLDAGHAAAALDR